jgi:hypothetical protein
MPVAKANQTVPAPGVMSKPHIEAHVQRARLRVIAPRDMAQARIEVTLPPGVRLSGALLHTMPGTAPQVLWRGTARRGQSIETEFTIDTSAAKNATLLNVQLVEITPSPLHRQAVRPNLDVQKPALSNNMQQRIVSRRSIAIPTSRK